MGHIPLDALPDISDVEVIIHTNWEGEPPNIIEDQVTYPIVTALLAAPNVKAVRAQTMFNDSYVFVIFEDGTDIYWARSRVVEYLQTIAGRLPADVHPAIGPDATGAGWVYEYVLVDHTHKYSLADLRTLQDWHLRYQLETVPGVAEVASIGGFVRQYQVNLDPTKLLAYGIPLSTVIDRVKSSTNEVGGRVLELSGLAIHDSWSWLSEISRQTWRTFRSWRRTALPCSSRTSVGCRSDRICERALRNGKERERPWAASW